MFQNCTAFNQNVGSFNLTAVTSIYGIFQNSGISVANYDAILTAWNTAGYTNKNLGDASL
jgi:surface protein